MRSWNPASLHRLRSMLFACITMLAASTCDPGATEPQRTVTLAISAADTISFGAVSSNLQLAATVTVSEGTVPRVIWKSTRTTVASISDTGFLLSASDGTAQIVATADQASDTVTVVVEQIPIQLRFDAVPTNAALGVPLFFPVGVSVMDSNGVLVSRAHDPVSLQLGQNPGGATLLGRTTVNAVRGTAQFDSLILDATGTAFTLDASMAALSLSSTPFDVIPGPDLVTFHNVDGQVVGAALDGQSTFFVNDYGAVTADSVVAIVFGNASRGDEIIAFVEGRPPEIQTSPVWSDGVDTVDVTFRDPLSISVTAWIVAGPFDELRARAIAQSATTSLIWAAERMGLSFDEFEIIDATSDPDATQLQSTTRCDQRALARSSIGVRLDRINIYYVGVVDNGRDRGYSCGDVIFMADRSGHELLAHEIGHSFGLGHIDNAAGYDRTNVMHSASSVREYLTEGQVFRQHFDMASALSVLYAIEPNGLRRCSHSAVSERCMELIMRLWSDGTFPPNR